MRKSLVAIVAVMLALALCAGASAAEKPRMVMMDLVPQGVSNEIAQSLTSLLALEIERARLYSVFTMQNLRAMMKLEEQKQLLGVEDPPVETLAKIGKAVNAPYVLHGTVGKVGKVMTISLDIVDVGQVKAVRRVTQTLVGDEAGLVGSLRTAAVALALDEKVGEDISAKLIDDLKIAEKEKKVFLAFSPGWMQSVGPAYNSSEPLAHLMPSYLDLRLDVDVPVWKWMRFFITTGFDMSIAERVAMQNKKVTLRYEKSDSNLPQNMTSDAATTDLTYSSMRVPVDFGIKFIPERGRFLPYGLLGLGFSWKNYSFDNEKLGFAYTNKPKTAGFACPAPYSLSNETDATYTCQHEVTLKPSRLVQVDQGSGKVEILEANKSVDMFGLDFVAGAGAELLLTHNIGLKFEARYIMTYLFNSGDDLTASFWSDRVDKDEGTTKSVRYGDAFSIWQIQHAISANMGLIVYF